MKVVLSTVLDFDSLEDLAAACVDCVENFYLDSSSDDGVPNNWDDPEVWDEETITDFLMYNGYYFIQEQGIDPECDLFNDNFSTTRVELKE